MRGLLEFIPPDAQRFSALKPRAAIVATKDVSLWPLPDEYTTPDVVACLWKTGVDRFPEIVLVSVYADGLQDAVSPELERLVAYCGSKNLPCIIGADSNSHSVLWGSEINNQRGDEYEAFMAANDLSVLNVGVIPTFKTIRAESIIDITLVHYSLYEYIDNWKVSEDDYLSDHRCISFQLNISPPRPQPVKNWQRTDWYQVSNQLQQRNSSWVAP